MWLPRKSECDHEIIQTIRISIRIPSTSYTTYLVGNIIPVHYSECSLRMLETKHVCVFSLPKTLHVAQGRPGEKN